MEGIQLHDRDTEDIVGTVILKNGASFEQVTDAWDRYMNFRDRHPDESSDIYEFANDHSNLCEVLEINFYQP